MQAVKSTKQAKAVTKHKVITHESVTRISLLSKIKSSVKAALFGDINDINPNSEKYKNHDNYQKAKNAERASTLRLQTLFK